MKKTGFLLILLSAVVTLTTAFSFESRPIHKTLNVTVTGSVVDEKGEAMAGAIVMVKGTKMGTSIDFDGKYRLSIPAQKCTLVCSAIGFVAQEKEVVLEEGKPQKVDFTMAENTQLLDAVVIREYKVPIVKVDQTVQGHQFTSSEIAKMPLSNSTAPKLQGRVAGVAVRGSRHIKLWGRKKSINTIQTPTIKGSRADGTDYYINGVRVRGKKNIKRFQDSIEQTAGFNTEEYGHWVENNYKSPKDDALSTFSIDVDRASYANVRRFIEQGLKPPAGAVRIEEMVNYFDYKYPQPTSEHPLSIISEIGTCPWQKDHLLLHIGLQGKKIDLEKAPKNNLVFLIDVSGSMNEPNKLPLVKDALRILINNLREEDRVAIVVYAGAAGVVLPSTSGANKGKILESLDALSAGGSTAGGAGIQLAYKIATDNFVTDGNNRIILATDGDFNVGVSSESDLISMIETQRKGGVFLSVCGFGMGNYKDSKMEQLADKGNGNYAYIDKIDEAQKVFGKEMGGTLYTIAKDVKLQLEFNPSVVESYRLIGYENRLLNKEDFNDDTKDAGEIGAGHTVTALYEIIPKGIKTNAKEVPSVDRVRYQKVTTKAKANGNELVFVKLRYKKPKEDNSILMEQVVVNQGLSLVETSNNFRFSAAVAGFAQILRGSKFVGDFDFAKVKTLALNSFGDDTEGYRANFVKLIERAERLNATAKK